MQYRTHFTTSLAVALPIMTATGTLSIGSVGALALGAVFPDIDEPHSWIGARTKGVSHVINLVFGHRGITHSLVGLILSLLTVLLMATLANFNVITGMYFALGYALHLVEDSFSKSGVKWLLPLTDKSFQFGNGSFYYTTGGFIENLILFGSVVILIIQIRSLNFESLSLPSFDVTETISGLFNNVQNILGNLFNFKGRI